MFQVTDQIGQTHSFHKVPQRVVSLVPSITYLLHSLGLDESIVGITRFCKYPKHFKNQKTIVGGTKQIDLERVKQLTPDLFIVSKEENTKEMADALQQIAPVFVTDVFDCNSNKVLMQTLGRIFHKKETANEILFQISIERSKLQANNFFKRTNAIYFIWQNPWMTIGGDTFINEMMLQAGFTNMYADQKRYPSIDLSTINQDEVDVILLSSEPFPFKEKHKKILQRHFPKTTILLVAGEPFTWFGAYPLEGFSYLSTVQKLISNAH